MNNMLMNTSATNINSELPRLTLKEMQEMLPDFVFKRLSDEDTRKFLGSLHNYPELQKEIDEVRAVFSRFERMDVDKIIQMRTRNLSVKVNNRLAAKKKAPVGSRFLKYIAPAFGLAFMVAVVISPDSFNFLMNSNQNKFEIFSNDSEIDSLFDDEVDLVDLSLGFADAINITNAVSLPSEEQTEIANDIVELCEEEILESIQASNEARLFTNPISEIDLMEQLDELDESEFQIILQELKNVKIPS